MGLIKSSSAPVKMEAFSLRDVEAQAALIMSRAKFKAEEMLARAVTDGETLRSAQHAQGLADGRRTGLAQGLEEGRKSGHAEALKATSARLEPLIAGLAGSAEKLELSRKRIESETVIDVIQLAAEIARRVTRTLGEIDPDVARANVAEALKIAVGASAVKVALHPSLVSIIHAEGLSLRKAYPRLETFEVVPDPALVPGGCRLVTGNGGIIDADLNTQLDRIVADFLPAARPDSPVAPVEAR